MTWEKKPAVEKPGFRSNCFNGGSLPVHLDLQAEIAVGFGSCTVTKDDQIIYIEDPGADQDAPRLQKFEDMAKQDPDHDWQVNFHGAMSEEIYQRHGDGLWALVQNGMGFA